MSDDNEAGAPQTPSQPQPIMSTFRPTIDLDTCLKIGKGKGLEPPFLLGLRGYEQEGQNSTGTYDDCICVVDQITFDAFNANTDPSKVGRGMATVIAPQVMEYKIGTHNINKEKEKQYQALVQASPIRVTREGIGEVPPGFFGINIHRGGVTTVGSEGCQTLPPNEWSDFMKCVWTTLRMRNIYSIKYLLVDYK